jgi:hypothetical protein
MSASIFWSNLAFASTPLENTLINNFFDSLHLIICYSQTESRREVGTLIGGLGIRDEQQFVCAPSLFRTLLIIKLLS